MGNKLSPAPGVRIATGQDKASRTARAKRDYTAPVSIVLV